MGKSKKKRGRKSKNKPESWKIQFFNHRTENAGKEQKEKALNQGYTILDLIKGPLGSTEHLKLRKTKHKNVKVSLDCEKNLELLLNLDFQDEDSFKYFKANLCNKDFIGLETKKYFLQSFIDNETSKALKLFDHEMLPKDFSRGDFSNSFKRSIDKNEISNMMKQQFNGSNEEVSCSQLFQLNDTNRLHSNQFMAESNLFLLGDSKKNSLGYFRGQDSQFMSILNGKDTPGDPSALMGDITKNNISMRRSKENSNMLVLTPLKKSKDKTPETGHFINKGFRDMKTNQIFLEKEGDNKPISNFIFHNDNPSKGFELTQKEQINLSQNLNKRGDLFESKNKKKPKKETPVYDFKNVTKKIYGVDNLKKLKKKDSKLRTGGNITNSLEYFLQDSDKLSRKENNKEIEKKMIEENLSNVEKDNSNLGNYSNSVNTRKSTKKYEEGLLNLYSKV